MSEKNEPTGDPLQPSREYQIDSNSILSLGWQKEIERLRDEFGQAWRDATAGNYRLTTS